MEEINNMESLTDTTPEAAPQGEPETQNPTENEGTPQPENPVAEGEEGSEQIPNAENEPFLPIQYNHESVELSKDEAVKLAQMGMKYQKSVEPLYNKLDYIAALQGTTPEALVDEMISRDETQYRQGLVEKFGEDGDEIEILLQAYRESQKQKYEKVLNDRAEAEKNAATQQKESLESRLANEFAELKAEFPEIADFASVPPAVKEMAAKGMDLMSAYLRYKYSEDKKVTAAKQAAESASKASTGSGASSEKQDDGTVSAMLKGIWS